MLPKTLNINVHSFVDLITNSSTEIYVKASDKTVESVKQIVNNILELGKSKFTCDDLFTVELNQDDVRESRESDYGFYTIRLLVKAKDESNEIGKTTATLLSRLTSLFSIDANYNG